MEWWDILGFDKDLKVTEVGKMNLIDRDGVHLTARANKCAAASLCDRIRVKTGRHWISDNWKRRRVGDLKKGRTETERELQECLIGCFDRVCLSAINYRL
jgi:hypothetical protein